MPAEITAHVGDTIEWVNFDFVADTATARRWFSCDVLIPDAKETIVLRTERTIEVLPEISSEHDGKDFG